MWTNVDQNTRGVTKLRIARRGNKWTIQAWGKCHPEDCDWGTVPLHLAGPSVSSQNYTHAFAKWNPGFATKYMTLRRRRDRLIAECINIFTDQSGRANTYAQYAFRKGGQIPGPGPVPGTRKQLKGTWTWDIDTNTDGDGNAADLWWQHVNERERYLVPKNGAGLTVVTNKTYESLTAADLRGMSYGTGRLSASDAQPTIDVGTVLAVRTNAGNWAKLKVLGFEPLRDRNIAKYHMNLVYVLYRGVEAGREDCISFSPQRAEVRQIQGRWKIVDGSHWMFDFGSNRAEADQALRIIKHYRMNQSCFVGRPDPSFQYMLVSGQAPQGSCPGEDCVSFNPQTAQVRQVSGRWKIVDGSHMMFDFANNKAEAEEALRIIKKYGFTRSCFVGRPDPSFEYLRK
jgi:hypothetical protein